MKLEFEKDSGGAVILCCTKPGQYERRRDNNSSPLFLCILHISLLMLVTHTEGIVKGLPFPKYVGLNINLHCVLLQSKMSWRYVITYTNTLEFRGFFWPGFSYQVTKLSTQLG